jgi:hypothetical protein
VEWALFERAGVLEIGEDEDDRARNRNPRARFKTLQQAEAAAERFARRLRRDWTEAYIAEYRMSRLNGITPRMIEDEHEPRTRVARNAKGRRAGRVGGLR